MCLRFAFLLITRMISWLRLSRREGAWQAARGPTQRDTESAAPGAEAAGHLGHDPALAPRHPPAPLDLCGANTPSLRLTCDIFSHPAPSPAGGGAFSSRTRSLLLRASGTIEGDTGGLSRVDEWSMRGPRQAAGSTQRGLRNVSAARAAPARRSPNRRKPVTWVS